LRIVFGTVGSEVVFNSLVTQAIFQTARAGCVCKPETKSALMVFLLMWAIAVSAQTVGSDGVIVKFTRPQLDAAIAQTKHENTRLEGLHELIRMAGPRLYEGSMIGGDPDPEIFKMEGDAARAVGACRDVATVGNALDSPIHSVRLWAVLSFETRPEYKDAWHPLVPKLIKMLSDPDPGFRQCAVDKLWFYPEGPRAIAEHAPQETDPDVLLRIARSGNSPNFYRSLVRLLSDSDARVRKDALSFIYLNLWNKATASMWRIGFNREVYERVRMLSNSSSPQERESAFKALSQLDLLKREADSEQQK
jgi:hypothetical protein